MLSDQQLGQRLGRVMAEQEAAGLSPAEGNRRLLAQLQDLLGANTSLASPLRDLLLRPAFRELFSDSAPARAQRQQHLLHDLSQTYSAAVVERLRQVLEGCLGQPATRGIAEHGTVNPARDRAVHGGPTNGTQTAPLTSSSQVAAAPFQPQPALSHSHSDIKPQAQGEPSTTGAAVIATPARAQGQPSAGLIAVIGLLAMLSGGLVAALGWVLHLQRQPLTASTGAAATSSLQQPASNAEPPAPVVTSAAAEGSPARVETAAEPAASEQRWQACVQEDGREGAAPQSGEIWWPVVGPADALEAARRHCRGDAFLNSQGNVQIASFRDRDSATTFAETLTADSSHPWGFRVGEASVRP